MKNKHIISSALALLFLSNSVSAQFADGDHWYDNPLGFEPLKLHTSMGVIVPSLAVGVCLLFTKKDSALQHKVSIYNETGLSWGYKFPYTLLPQNNTGVNVQLRKFISVGVEFDVFLPRDNYNKTIGFSIRPFARFFIVNKTNWRLYFESGGGLIYLLDEFPMPTEADARLGTQWNGMTKYGLGAEVHFWKRNAFLLGVRHIHISNGNTKGVERNPSHDSNGFFVGISRTL